MKKVLRTPAGVHAWQDLHGMRIVVRYARRQDVSVGAAVLCVPWLAGLVEFPQEVWGLWTLFWLPAIGIVALALALRELELELRGSVLTWRSRYLGLAIGYTNSAELSSAEVKVAPNGAVDVSLGLAGAFSLLVPQQAAEWLAERLREAAATDGPDLPDAPPDALRALAAWSRASSPLEQ